MTSTDATSNKLHSAKKKGDKTIYFYRHLRHTEISSPQGAQPCPTPAYSRASLWCRGRRISDCTFFQGWALGWRPCPRLPTQRQRRLDERCCWYCTGDVPSWPTCPRAKKEAWKVCHATFCIGRSTRPSNLSWYPQNTAIIYDHQLLKKGFLPHMEHGQADENRLYHISVPAEYRYEFASNIVKFGTGAIFRNRKLCYTLHRLS